MNRLLHTILPLLLLIGLLILCLDASAQTISSRDSEEIKLLARRKVEKSLVDLLNVLTLEDLEESQRKAIVAKSLTDTEKSRRLFYSTDVIVEDDLQPERPIDQPTDVKIEKYLANLDLFYTKSPERTITFSDMKVSNVKERVYTYVKVYYTETFKGKNTQSTAAFRPMPRVAEVRAERVGKKWTLMIAQIGFLAPGDSATSPLNDVKLVEPEAPVDSTAMQARLEQESLQAAERERERERERLAQKVYESYLTKGDQALAAKDFQGALQNFQEAEKRKTSDDDILPATKIEQVKRLKNASQIAERELLRDYRDKADLASKKRQYAEALSYYHKILAKYPDSTALITVVKELTQKSNRKTEYDEQFAAGQYEPLVDAYDKVIKRDNTNSDWYLGRGRCYVKLNKDDRALRDFTKSLELDYANLATLLARAELYRKQGNLPKAIADYSAYLIIDPKNDNVYAQRAQLRVGTNNLSSADDDFTQAIALNGQQPTYYTDRGLLRYRNLKYDEAIADFSKAISLAPTVPEPYFWRGLMYAIQKQYSLTGADFANTVKYKAPDKLIARADSVMYHHYESGQQANTARNYAEAVVHLTDALSIRSTSPKALYERGFAQYKQGNYKEAIDDLTASLALAPNESPTYDCRADAYMATENYDLAASDYRKSTAITPTNYAAMLGEGTALLALKKYTAAIPPLVSVKSAQKKTEKNFTPAFFRDVFYRLGQCEYATNQYEKAIDDYTAALKLDETFADGFYARGTAYEAYGKLDRAIDDYQRAIDRTPNSAERHYAKAYALEKKGDYALAVTAYGEVIRLDSTRQLYTGALLRRGTTYLLAGQANEALSDLEQPTLQADTTMCGYDCWLNTGLAHLYTGKPDAGLPYLAKCLSNSTYAGRAAYATACASLQKDNESEALVWFDKALQDKSLTIADIKRDRLIDVARKDYRRSKAFKQLIDKYKK
ncbi:tetratricopeptide repeat protein [uncultured Spirosoma sp.]|uniref:tetratricopeptide repeat protein n=1 Tax=uncultured Spirosoma sp. TaxID=278208 RepID=UPI00258725DA|nr:tetratricopeptide repeat protein [uncultured Spirosoma sp.]